MSSEHPCIHYIRMLFNAKTKHWENFPESIIERVPVYKRNPGTSFYSGGNGDDLAPVTTAGVGAGNGYAGK